VSRSKRYFRKNLSGNSGIKDSGVGLEAGELKEEIRS
jgi:hypothetical protein